MQPVATAGACAEAADQQRQETMKAYVIRRAGEVKRYDVVAKKTGVNRHWIAKLAIGKIPRPNYDDIQTLFDYYRRLEAEPA